MKRLNETKKNGAQKRRSAASQTNSMQRKGQTVTILFGRKPGPSVKLLFEEADLQACNNLALGIKSS
jgi:hypothetical protein